MSDFFVKIEVLVRNKTGDFSLKMTKLDSGFENHAAKSNK